MRIGFDAHVLDGRNQGTKTLMLRVIDQAARRHPNHDFYVYSEDTHDELDFGLVNLHHRATRHRGFAKHLLYTLPRSVRVDRLDTMIFNFIQSPLVRNATVMIHDILPQTHPRFFSSAFVARCWAFFGMSALLARNLFTISEHSRDEIMRIYPWTTRKGVSVLHIGASFTEDTYFSSATSSVDGKQGRYALVVGRIEPRKNVQMAIDAFRAGAPEDVRLLIVGRREPGIAIDTGDDPRIVEMVGVSDEDLITLYRDADLFIYPSIAEGFGLPLLDAILFGVPTISSELTSMREVGRGGATFFDPLAPQAVAWLSQKIAGHFGDEPIPAPSMAVRQERAQLYSWRNAADELVAGIASKQS